MGGLEVEVRGMEKVGKVSEKTWRVTFELPEDLFEKLTLLSVRTRRAKKDLVLEAIKEYVEKNKDLLR
jgi:predicted DNA-binding protein